MGGTAGFQILSAQDSLNVCWWNVHSHYLHALALSISRILNRSGGACQSGARRSPWQSGARAMEPGEPQTHYAWMHDHGMR